MMRRATPNLSPRQLERVTGGNVISYARDKAAELYGYVWGDLECSNKGMIIGTVASVAAGYATKNPRIGIGAASGGGMVTNVIVTQVCASNKKSAAKQ